MRTQSFLPPQESAAGILLCLKLSSLAHSGFSINVHCVMLREKMGPPKRVLKAGKVSALA
jgi:hypothetical protein